MSLLKELKEKNAIHDCSNFDELSKFLEENKTCFYCGFDPTADSLHVGSLLPLIIMRKLQLKGHFPIILIGTATGMIGDPSGKSEERVLLTQEIVHKNAESISNQVGKIVDLSDAKIINNHTRIEKIKMIDFLRDLGKHFSVNSMIAKESVKERLNNREQGISFTEFSYMLLQSYDFYWLNQNHDCQLQIGGSDQWGNITAGLELIRKKQSEKNRSKDSNEDKKEETPAFGFTFPLLKTASGTKFGKTEAGAIWLDKNKTSAYNFYQFWLNSSDDDLENFFNLFSFKEKEEIADILEMHRKNPEKRIAQKELAQELTKLLHGEEETLSAVSASDVLFNKNIKEASSSDLMVIFKDVPHVSIKKSELKSELNNLQEILVKAGAAKSNSEARRKVEAGSIYLNDEKQSDFKKEITSEDFIEGKVLIIRSGKKNYYLVKLK